MFPWIILIKRAFTSVCTNRKLIERKVNYWSAVKHINTTLNTRRGFSIEFWPATGLICFRLYIKCIVYSCNDRWFRNCFGAIFDQKKIPSYSRLMNIVLTDHHYYLLLSIVIDIERWRSGHRYINLLWQRLKWGHSEIYPYTYKETNT